MAPVTPNTRVFFKEPVFGVTAMDIAETLAVFKALTVATSAAATTVGGATGRMIVITRALDNTAHSVHVDNCIGAIDLTVVIPADKP